MEGSRKVEKQKSIKISLEAYIMLRKLSSLLNLKQKETVYISLGLMYLLLTGESEKARELLRKLQNRMERQRWLWNQILESLEKVAQS